MKQRIIMTLFMTTAVLMMMGCGASHPEEPVRENSAKEPKLESETETEQKNSGTSWIPETAVRIKSETKPHKMLQEKIIEYYEIPEDDLESTRYYYNYVDLDGDGENEIFAIVVGMYTSGSGGNSALWCQEVDGELKIKQAFTLVNPPLMITKETPENADPGSRGLIMDRSGGGASSELVELICKDGIFTNVSEEEPLEDSENLEGTVILDNNLAEDIDQGEYLTLAD